MNDVVVTGAAGFIGKALCRRLKADGVAVHPHGRCDGDISMPDTWRAMPPARVLVHLAGRSYVPDISPPMYSNTEKDATSKAPNPHHNRRV